MLSLLCLCARLLIVYRRAKIREICLVIIGLAVLLTATPHAAQAQRRLRLTLGATTSSYTWTSYSATLFGGSGNITSSSIAAMGGIAYDVRSIAKGEADNPLIVSVYYDHFSYFDLFSNDAPTVGGIELTIRKQLPFFYFGAGVGFYGVDWHGSHRANSSNTEDGTINPGGKIFVGLQGRGSLFIEFAATRLVSSGLEPGATLLLGLRL